MLKLIATLAASIAGTALALPDAPASAATGTTQVYEFPSTIGTVHYRVYTPPSARTGAPVPLVVFAHGCSATAAQQQAASGYDDVADRFGFEVLYVDNDDGLHPRGCWRFYNASDERRDSGDVALIAGMTKAVIAADPIDQNRVYALGMSSGAFMAGATAAAYPDIFAAAGLMAGGPFGSSICLSGAATPVNQPAELTAAAQPQAHVMPFIELHGDADTTVSPQCGTDAVDQWTRTDNRVIGGNPDTPISTTPSSTTAYSPAGLRSYEVSTYAWANCPIGEHWVIHGMNHYWSGGTADPLYAKFTDPSGPSAAEATWNFFSRYRKTASTCPGQ
ncbi:extracellular catalytic domain type 1 short-chain-length polyhydroxyalkanoate depolymerase [Nocardia sp. CDC160]|uniref:extracellular catalytic domain type 1 short-chain-length polyhydroxyalkanoate depolymerase n=1 Tax=Nocardia sp. CDC160 TaxID=3112166 RepID=UPI002DC05598|nr:PHB depolymerase family esterase [Nocardia sp. CDC160]MEC3916802.1 PHB depolymerase family esterase [Nocardia sp. CDC160]